MSYNIHSIDIIDCDAFCITRPKLEEIRSVLKDAEGWPAASVLHEEWAANEHCCEEVRGLLFVKHFWWNHDGSGHTFDELKNIVLPAFMGRADLVLTWERGDSHTGLRLLNGKVTDHDVVFTLGKERISNGRI